VTKRCASAQRRIWSVDRQKAAVGERSGSLSPKAGISLSGISTSGSTSLDNSARWRRHGQMTLQHPVHVQREQEKQHQRLQPNVQQQQQAHQQQWTNIRGTHGRCAAAPEHEGTPEIATTHGALAFRFRAPDAMDNRLSLIQRAMSNREARLQRLHEHRATRELSGSPLLSHR